MPYRDIIFAPGNYYHVFCRGNEKRDIFLDDNDYERFLLRMKEYKIIHQISIICYCLMPNHFHILLRQNTNRSVSSFIHRLTVGYSMYFNKRYNRVGHLFEGSFKAKIIAEDEYLLHLSRYIHLNPRKISNTILDLKNYPWSSYAEYLKINNNREICEKDIILQQFNNVDEIQSYRKFVDSLISDRELIKLQGSIIEPA